MYESDILTALQNLVLALNNVNTTLQNLPLNSIPVTASAGVASGNYGTVIGDDGNPYKIELLNPV